MRKNIIIFILTLSAIPIYSKQSYDKEKDCSSLRHYLNKSLGLSIKPYFIITGIIIPRLGQIKILVSDKKGYRLRNLYSKKLVGYGNNKYYLEIGKEIVAILKECEKQYLLEANKKWVTLSLPQKPHEIGEKRIGGREIK